MLRDVVPEDFDSTAALLIDVTCDLVSQSWPDIERVACALLSKGRLSGDEVAALIR
jgi:hypothetical protein